MRDVGYFKADCLGGKQGIFWCFVTHSGMVQCTSSEKAVGV